MSVIPRLTPQELFDIGVAGYLQELSLLSRIAATDTIARILPLFADYKRFLQSGLHTQFSTGLLGELVNEEGIIDISQIPASGEPLFLCASLAAACETFNGWAIDIDTLTTDKQAALLQQNILLSGESQQRLGQIMGVRLNRSDALRVAQIVKLLGLLSPQASQYHQLALGASLGRRDREGFHRLPGINPEKSHDENSAASRLNFTVKNDEPASLCIIDNDKNLATDFAEINRARNPALRALLLDLYDGLEGLATELEKGAGRPFNLITMFRLEPRAMPDIPAFVNKIDRVVKKEGHFLATTGSGDTHSEFEDRQRIMDELADQLRARGRQPLRIKLYDQKRQTNGRIRPAFGIAEFASFEILFCKL